MTGRIAVHDAGDPGVGAGWARPSHELLDPFAAQRDGGEHDENEEGLPAPMRGDEPDHHAKANHDQWEVRRIGDAAPQVGQAIERAREREDGHIERHDEPARHGNREQDKGKQTEERDRKRAGVRRAIARRVHGAGAAGGLGGGLVALGGVLRSGYGLVRDLVGLPAALDAADRVVTGEGALDATSFAGKVVGGVVADARGRVLPTLVVAGRCSPDGVSGARAAGCDVVSLTERFGPGPAGSDTESCIRSVTAEWLGSSGA